MGHNEEQYVIRGGRRLEGEVVIAGAKNAALGILAAAVMTDDKVTIENVPYVSDTRTLLKAIENIGATVEYKDRHTVVICGKGIRERQPVDDEYIRKIRASYYLIGALLGNILPESVMSALALAIYGMFIAIVVPEMRKAKPVILAVILAFGFSSMFYYIPLLKKVSSGLSISICAIAAALICAVLFPVSDEDKADEANEKLIDSKSKRDKGEREDKDKEVLAHE